MWQLVLLGQVIPVFGALAKEFVDREEKDPSLASDARDCYADIVIIGQALAVSHGEWASDLRDEVLVSLLGALESRLPKPKDLKTIFAFATLSPADQEDQYPRLRDLSKSLRTRNLGGFNECYELPSQTPEVRKEYQVLVGETISLLHGKEKTSRRERQKFTSRIISASKHLLDVYCRETSAMDAEEFHLSQHPSHGIKDTADRVYDLLRQHWNCPCSRHPWDVSRTGCREARLNLIRFRQLAPKMTTLEAAARSHAPVKFEVLLPICRDDVQWKVTNIEVKRHIAQRAARRHAINNDVCRWLFDRDGFHVDFEAENDSLWHLTPDLPDDTADCHGVMESLSQLLGNGVGIPGVAKYTPREKLTLCYILANSMLFLYPGHWLHSTWTSTKVYFVRQVISTNPSSTPTSVLTFPYLSVELQQTQCQAKNEIQQPQYHSHPAIMGLGIIFLEVATGVRFQRSGDLNTDYLEALRKLKALNKESERHRSKRISSTLYETIYSCLSLKPPPNFPSEGLAQEGPIRQYILSCIVQPLAKELRDGHKVDLEALDRSFMPGSPVNNKPNGGTGAWEDEGVDLRRSSTSTVDELSPLKVESHQSVHGHHHYEGKLDNPVTTHGERREICLFADDRDVGMERPVDQDKVSSAETWFEYHNDAASRIRKELRKAAKSDAQKVRIAIMDSGLHLSSAQKAQYGFGSGIVFRSFIDPECSQWKDEVGHGTHLAVLLRKIAENTEIFVGRVFKKKPSLKSVDTIAEAIRYAVDEWQVDIIVMSFGFGQEADILSKAIDHAASNKVLMFAAASNEGKNRPDGVAWPASRPDVFCVHAASGKGARSHFTPAAQDGMRIMTLGECVRSAWPPFPDGSKRQMPGDSKLMSGTSCAAPIAAGIAAIILDLARGFLDDDDWKRLRRPESIQRMFRHLRDQFEEDSGHWWIVHWKLFDPKYKAEYIEQTIKTEYVRIER